MRCVSERVCQGRVRRTIALEGRDDVQRLAPELGEARLDGPAVHHDGRAVAAGHGDEGALRAREGRVRAGLGRFLRRALGVTDAARAGGEAEAVREGQRFGAHRHVLVAAREGDVGVVPLGAHHLAQSWRRSA